MVFVICRGREIIGFVKDAIDEALTEQEEPRAIDYRKHLKSLAAENFDCEVTSATICYKLNFTDSQYIDFDLPRPISKRKVHAISDSDSEDIGGPTLSKHPAKEAEELREKQKEQAHPNTDKAKKIKKTLDKMSKCKVVTKVSTAATGDSSKKSSTKKDNSGGKSAKTSNDGGRSGDKSGDDRSSRSRKRSHGGRRGGDGDDGGDEDEDGYRTSSSDSSEERKKKKKKKKKSKKRKRSSSSDSSDDEIDCKAKACSEKFKNKAEMKLHLKTCRWFCGDESPVPWGKAKADMEEHHIEFFQTKFPEFTDDNLNALVSHLMVISAKSFYKKLSFLAQSQVAAVPVQLPPGLCQSAYRCSSNQVQLSFHRTGNGSCQQPAHRQHALDELSRM